MVLEGFYLRNNVSTHTWQVELVSFLRWTADTCERNIFAFSSFLDLGMVAAVRLPLNSAPLDSWYYCRAKLQLNFLCHRHSEMESPGNFH